MKQNSNLKESIVKLHKMGFSDEKIERAFHYEDILSIEEVMNYLVPNNQGYWDHKFIPESQCSTQKKCLLCRRPERQNLGVSSTFKQQSIKLKATKFRTTDLELGSPQIQRSKKRRYIVHEDKIIKNNSLLIEISEPKASDISSNSNAASPVLLKFQLNESSALGYKRDKSTDLIHFNRIIRENQSINEEDESLFHQDELSEKPAIFKR